MTNAPNFMNVPTVPASTSRGSLRLPLLFSETRVRQMHYWVEPARVHPKLDRTGLTASEFINGKCLVSLTLFDYRSVADIPAYEEIVITILCRPASDRSRRAWLPPLAPRGVNWKVGAYVLEMPVTVPEARAAGRELWGFPKFVARITHDWTGRDFATRVADRETDRPIVSISGRCGRGLRLPANDLVTLSNHKDTICKTIIDVDGTMEASRPSNVRVTVGSHDHRLARNVLDLGLDQSEPFLIQHGDHIRSRLNAGVSVEPWPNAPALPYAAEVPQTCAGASQEPVSEGFRAG